MKRPEPPVLSILLLGEDSAGDAPATLKAIVLRMFRLIVPETRTNRIEFEPPNERARRAVVGNAWHGKGPGDYQKLIDLRQTVATKLLEPGESGFVLWHFDGDRAYSERASSHNAAEFSSFIERFIRPQIHGALAKKGLAGDDLIAEERRRIHRLLTLVPFYSIEAWLFQNTAVAARLCREKGCGAHIDLLDEWAADRRKLDEIEKPKELLCIRAAHNLELATTQYPAESVFAAGASYSAAVQALLDCADLGAALTRTTI